jgi:excisionase family DNA binding protein
MHDATAQKKPRNRQNLDLIGLIADEVEARIAERISTGKRLFKVKEAAEYLGCSENQVRAFIANGRVDCVAIDGHARLDRRDLDLMIDRSKGEAL